MQPNNLTALDFEDIKASIKSYLRTRTEFSDYDFEGSALSYLIDTLAYNSYYMDLCGLCLQVMLSLLKQQLVE